MSLNGSDRVLWCCPFDESYLNSQAEMPRTNRLRVALQLLAVLSSVGLSSATGLRASDGFSIIPGSVTPPPGPDTFTILEVITPSPATPSPSQTQPTTSPPLASPVGLPTIAPVPIQTPNPNTAKPPKAKRTASADVTPTSAPTPAPTSAPTSAPTKKSSVAKATKKKRHLRRFPSAGAAISVQIDSTGTE